MMLPFKISLILCYSMYCNHVNQGYYECWIFRYLQVYSVFSAAGFQTLFFSSFIYWPCCSQANMCTRIHTHTHTDNTGVCEIMEVHSRHSILSVMILQPHIPVELCHLLVPNEASEREVIALTPKSSSAALQVQEHEAELVFRSK